MSLFDNIDFSAAQDEIAAIITDSIDDLVDGAREDLQRYGQDIAKDLIRAIKDDRPDLRRELVAQARALAEIHRIRLNREARTVLYRVLEVASRVGKSLLTAAVAAI